MSRYYMIANRLKNSHLPKNRKYSGIKLLVSKEEFITWFMAKDFKGSSVDRIDKNGHYDLANMQVITLRQNIVKEKLKSKNGLCVCRVCENQKPLDQFVKDNRQITTGYSTICKSCEVKRTRSRKFTRN